MARANTVGMRNRIPQDHTHMTHPTLYLIVFAVACLLAYFPSNCAVFRIVGLITNDYRKSSDWAWAVGTFERILYVMAVLSQHYDLITAWIVMKAFSGWMRLGPRKDEHERLSRWNKYLLGNIVSLLAGLGLGVILNLYIRLRLGIPIIWSP